VSGQIFDDTTGCGRVVDVWVLVEPEPEVVVVDEDVEAPFVLPPAKMTTSTTATAATTTAAPARRPMRCLGPSPPTHRRKPEPPPPRPLLRR
jgi:hypothetical protein